ncbi:MAG: hypothetical protein IPM47_13290 [Sphingobacteriales bacterium]|nr:MAG: hypothetical protein IPM47_13290 [Sphingobacteriales bacterium]
MAPHQKKVHQQTLQSLELISNFFTETINNITPDMVKSICSYQYICLNTFWAV